MREETVFPPSQHVCRPGWRIRDGGPFEDGYLENVGGFWPEGTVDICECGRSYIAYRPYSNIFVNFWRRETRWERRRRERRARRDGRSA